MINFSVGYQFRAETGRSFAEELCALKDRVAEVYFPWLGEASGRGSLTDDNGGVNWDGQAMLERDIRLLRDNGVALNLLFNAN